MKNKKAFTLIELLVVIAAIGLLSSIVLVALKGTRERAEIARNLSFSGSVDRFLGVDAVGIWDFNEISPGNIVRDRSGQDNHGTIHGGVTLVRSIPELGNALSFDGSTGRVVGSGLPRITGPWTLCAWIYPKSARSQMIINTHSLCGGMSLHIKEDNKVITHKGCVVWGVRSTKSVELNKWNHTCVTWDNVNTHLVAINGGIETLTEASQTIASDGGFSIGARGDGIFAFHGLIDEPRIYNRALTVGEIQKHYAEGLEKHQNLVNK